MGLTLDHVAWVFLVLSAFGCVVSLFELPMIYWQMHKRLAEPTRWPSFSLLKPLAGIDDDLENNLRTHLAIDYPGEWEILLGVRDSSDPAHAVAQKFVAEHPQRVRLHLQEGAPGHNPKVNQLITLTRHAKYEVIALTDSNIRVKPSLLREHAATLAPEDVALTSQFFTGVEEQSFGSVLDNLTLASFNVPNITTAAVLLRITQIVGKSLAIKRVALDAIGGWETVKDLLAEDQRLGRSLRKAKFRTAMCPTPAENVQRTQTVGHFFARHSRWAMIRFRVLLPGVLFEPILYPFVMALVALAAAPSTITLGAAAATAIFSIVFTQVCALMSRGYGFSLAHLLVVPLRDVLVTLAWAWGAFKRTVTWRGHRFNVGKLTVLSPVPGPDKAALPI